MLEPCWQAPKAQAGRPVWEFRLDIRRNFFTEGVVEHWTRLPGDMAGSASVEMLKKGVEVALGGLA